MRYKSFDHFRQKCPRANHKSVFDRLNPAKKPDSSPVTDSKAKPGHDQPNRTEMAYRAILEGKKEKGEVIAYQFTPETLYLAEGGKTDQCTYTPDFKVIAADGVHEFHEVKGGWVYDDAKVKFKLARRLFPQYRWVWAQLKGKKNAKKWHIKVYEVNSMATSQYPDYRYVHLDPETLEVKYLGKSAGKIRNTGKQYDEGKQFIYEHDLSKEIFYTPYFAAFDLVACKMRRKEL